MQQGFGWDGVNTNECSAPIAELNGAGPGRNGGPIAASPFFGNAAGFLRYRYGFFCGAILRTVVTANPADQSC
jgi:hypothetical protein